MAVSKQRKRTPKASRAQHSKEYYLPMAASDADAVILGVRIALESIRRGSSGRAEAFAMAQALMLTTYVSEAGHGALRMSDLAKAEIGLNNVLAKGAQSDEWSFPGDVLDTLARVVNEHDRQLHEVRLGVVIEAMKRVRRFVSQGMLVGWRLG